MTLPSVADSVEPAGSTVGSGPPGEATRTRNRGSWGSPLSQFQSTPAEWKTSRGPIAVDA